jgi:hypothetical protein
LAAKEPEKPLPREPIVPVSSTPATKSKFKTVTLTFAPSTSPSRRSVVKKGTWAGKSDCCDETDSWGDSDHEDDRWGGDYSGGDDEDYSYGDEEDYYDGSW